MSQQTNPEIVARFAALPKVELHCHLDCSLSFDVVHRLDPRVDRAAYARDYVAPAQCRDLAEYLQRAPMGFRMMQTTTALAAVTFDFFQQLRRDNVVYAEIRFAPLQHTAMGLSPEDVVVAVLEAATQAGRETGVQWGMLLCTLRHFTAEQSMTTAQLVDRYRDQGVVGLDLAGDEAGHPLDNHRAAYAFAKDKGLQRTAHAGEAAGASSVWQTLQELAPQRIGHGVRAVEDPALVEHLVDQGIHLEICPSCNVQIGIFPSLAEHAIAPLVRAGVSVGINTDARQVTPTDLTREYVALHQAFGWDERDFAQCNRAALKAAFIGPQEKAQLQPHFDPQK